MNKSRKKELYDVTSILDDAIDRLEEIKNDEQDSFDLMPEGFQNSIRGDSMQKAMDRIDGFVTRIEKVKEDIEKMAKGK